MVARRALQQLGGLRLEPGAQRFGGGGVQIARRVRPGGGSLPVQGGADRRDLLGAKALRDIPVQQWRQRARHGGEHRLTHQLVTEAVAVEDV